MTEHLSSEQIQKYRQRVLPPSELLATDRHLAECGTCREQLGGVESAAALLTDLRAAQQEESDHLSYEQMAAYIDLRTDDVDREIVEGHVEFCSRCEAELGQLQKFAAELSSAFPSKSLSIRARLSKLWSAPRFRFAAATFGLALIVGALTLSVYQFRGNPSTVAKVGSVEPAPGPEAPKTPGLGTNPQTLVDAGRTITLDQDGIHGLQAALPSSLQNVIAEAINAPQVATTPASHGLMKEPGSHDLDALLVSPVDTAVENTKPIFRWKPLSRASNYTVKVYGTQNRQVIMNSGPINETQWTASHSLVRGDSYSWRLIVKRGEEDIIVPIPPHSPATFEVLSKASAREVGLAKRQYPDSRLVLGIVYQRTGMLEQAEKEFRLLREANPESPLARKLLINAEAQRTSVSNSSDHKHPLPR